MRSRQSLEGEFGSTVGNWEYMSLLAGKIMPTCGGESKGELLSFQDKYYKVFGPN